MVNINKSFLIYNIMKYLFKFKNYTLLENNINTIETMVAYHGSPYSFDEFSTSQIGTGEGVTGWGYGIYFTESEEDAEDYARKLEREEDEGVVYTVEIPHKKYYFNSYFYFCFFVYG